jgi:hypothetical protein
MRISKLVSGVALAAAISGAALLSVGGAQASSLIVNGGFETGDFTGWVADAVSFPMGVGGPPFTPVNSGDFAAQIAGFSFGPDTLSQTVADTAGQNYILSFARLVGDGAPTVSLDVTWNGNSIFSELNPATVNVYQTFAFNVVGTGTDALVFTSANDPSFTYLDDVSLTSTAATPLPSTWLMLLSGFVGLGFFAYRGTKKRTVLAAA